MQRIRRIKQTYHANMQNCECHSIGYKMVRYTELKKRDAKNFGMGKWIKQTLAQRQNSERYRPNSRKDMFRYLGEVGK